MPYPVATNITAPAANGTAAKICLPARRVNVNLLKRGVHFVSQDTNEPLLQEEIPLVVMHLTPVGRERAALVGMHYFQTMGYSLNQALELLGDTPKEQP
jgi:hypothetical protein